MSEFRALQKEKWVNFDVMISPCLHHQKKTPVRLLTKRLALD